MIHLSPRLPPKDIFQGAWQVQHEGHAQRGTGAGQFVADEVTVEPEIDLRFQGILRAEVEQEEQQILPHRISRLHRANRAFYSNFFWHNEVVPVHKTFQTSFKKFVSQLLHGRTFLFLPHSEPSLRKP